MDVDQRSHLIVPRVNVLSAQIAFLKTTLVQV